MSLVEMWGSTLKLNCLHCRSYVRLGKWNIDSPNIIDVPVAKFIAHAQYDLATQQNDIGLVKLQSNILYTGTLEPSISTSQHWPQKQNENYLLFYLFRLGSADMPTIVGRNNLWEWATNPNRMGWNWIWYESKTLSEHWENWWKRPPFYRKMFSPKAKVASGHHTTAKMCLNFPKCATDSWQAHLRWRPITIRHLFGEHWGSTDVVRRRDQSMDTNRVVDTERKMRSNWYSSSLHKSQLAHSLDPGEYGTPEYNFRLGFWF